MKKINFSLLIIIILVALTACGLNGNIQNTPVENPEPLPPVNDVAPPSDSELSLGNVYLSSSEIFIMESFPVQVSINLLGDLPTPCHVFNYSIEMPYENNEIRIEVYSEADLDQMCVEMLEPFEENISVPLENLEDGNYSVFVNGELVGEFSYPG